NDGCNTGAGGAQTTAVTGTVTVNNVNDPPVNTVPPAQSTGMNSNLLFANSNGNLISVTDLDNSTLTVTLSVTNGTLTLSGMTGLTFTAGDGTADTTMTFSGTQAAINAALDGLTYTPTAGYTG